MTRDCRIFDYKKKFQKSQNEKRKGFAVWQQLFTGGKKTLVKIWNKIFDCTSRSSHPDVFLRKGGLKIFSKFTGKQPCRSVISIKLQSRFIEIPLWHGCSPVDFLHIFRKPFPRNTLGWLLLYNCTMSCYFQNQA